MAEHLESGRKAERIARRFLEKRGLRLIVANYRCRYGELDLVMHDKRRLIIIEIRYRRDRSFMSPGESIDAAKRQRIARASLHFIQHNPQHQRWPVRFDVVSLSGPLDDTDIDWMPGAFTAEDLHYL
jgi:putative endonuclease